uniref:DNA mismatch repair protein n=1 Tax=Panagrellus redivivus TaxID=6233 RepID=A0A7E4VTL2_PANRE
MSMNTRRSTKSPKQPSIPVPGPSKPAKSPQPQPKESKKKASTKTTTPETALLPRLRTEMWRNLLRSGALRFPEQQVSANESLPISANDLSNALRKREAEECKARSPPSEASPDSGIAKPADGEESVDKGNESTTKAPQKSPVKSPERPVTSPKKPPTPTVPLPSEATDDRKEAAPGDAAKDKPSKSNRKRVSESDSDKGQIRRPRLDVPILAIDDKSKDESANADDPKKPTESIEGTAQSPPAVAQSDEDAQEEPAETMEPVNAPPEDVAMDAFFDVPPPDDLDPMSELENDAASEAQDVESTVDLESSEVGSVNGSEASEVGSLIISEASESGSARSESPGPSTRPSRKRKAAPNTNDGPSARRRPPQTDSDSDEAPQPRSSNRRARQPRNSPTFGHLEHIEDIEGVDLPNAPPVVVRQREVVDNVRLTADQQVEVLRGNDVTIARYESGAVVMQGRFNGGSTASQLMRDALRQPQVLFNDPEDRIVQIALGNEHLIMRSISGDIYTVGRATEGQLGVARHRFYRQSSVTPQAMRRIVVDDEGHDVFFTDIRADGNVTIAIASDGSEYRCGDRHGPLLAKLRRD